MLTPRLENISGALNMFIIIHVSNALKNTSSGTD